MAHFEHGAIDKETTKLIDPRYAVKRVKYECPDCKRDVFVRKGDKKVPHFAHTKDSTRPCTYFNRNPSLDQQHRNAQLKLKEFLNNKVEIELGRYCMCGCHSIEFTIIPASHRGEGRTEYKFTFNGSRKSADVALVNGDEIEYIFEIVHTHYTRERDRPEPWFEIRAENVNNTASDSEKIVLTCIRQVRLPECIEYENARAEHVRRLKETQRIEAEKVRLERIEAEKARLQYITARNERQMIERGIEEQRLNMELQRKFGGVSAQIAPQIASETPKEAEERNKREGEERRLQTEFNVKQEEIHRKAIEEERKVAHSSKVKTNQ